jgi:hypothetical protein
MYVAANPYATLCFTIGDNKPWIGGKGQTSGPGYLMEGHINPLVNRVDSNGNPIFNLKLFYIEQGAPAPSLSGGKSNINTNTYDYYSGRKLGTPYDNTQPYVNIPWDIQLSYNLGLDLTQVVPFSAFDASNNPINYNDGILINRNGSDLINTYFKADGSMFADNNDYLNYLSSNNSTFNGSKATIDFTNAPVKFYARSVIETGSHTFEYMGTGTRMKYAIPAFGGVTNNLNEAISDGINDDYGNKPGTVFFTSSNELGNFKVGTDFTIVQSTGTIQGETFNRAILTLVTPLTIVLE